MSPEDIKALRHRLGWSVNELAEALKLSPAHGGRKVRRWELGELELSGPAEVALEAIEAGFIPAHMNEENTDD